ncbi:hypothetical protein [Streptomyces sp. NPDC005435]|uniref:hypothetical protein n=1 Tax=Streptomyces sp. NPDC005435 TaxID=3154464 RepID=UPI0034571421
MRSPAELDQVPWHELTHAYGTADDVPDLLLALYRHDAQEADETIGELFGTICHQGTVSPAAAPAVPFLTHAVHHASARRDHLLMLLASLAGHPPERPASPGAPGSPAAAARTEVCRVLPELVPCLADGERAVRRAALRVIAAVAALLPPEARATVTTRVEALYAGDPVPSVRADALVVLNLLGRELLPLDSELPACRLAAAVLAAERSGPPYAAGLVEIFARDRAATAPDAFPWPGRPTPDEQLTRLLARDPDAALTVAARWITDGDTGSCGSWLAQRVITTWRDREPEVLGLLHASLPHRKETRALAHGLSVIGDWIDRLPEPDPALLDTLYAHARAGDPEIARPALLALVRARDPRALELVLRTPEADALASAATSFPEAAGRLIPALRAQLAAAETVFTCVTLIDALESFGPAAAQAGPELLDCLRTGRAAHAAARLLGLHAVPTPRLVALLREAVRDGDDLTRAAAAAAHHRLTGEPGLALGVFAELLSSGEPVHRLLDATEPLGTAAAPLLPLVEPLPAAGHDGTRMAAAEAHLRISGSPDRALPVITALAGPTPAGVRALRALTALGEVPEEIRPVLRGLAFSPVRLISDPLFEPPGRPDHELRTLAWNLLTTGQRPPTP